MWVCKYVHICVFCPQGTCCTVPLTQTVWAGEGLPGGVDSSPRACSAPPTGQWGTTSQLHFLKLARFQWGLQFSLLHQGKCFLWLYLDSLFIYRSAQFHHCIIVLKHLIYIQILYRQSTHLLFYPCFVSSRISNCSFAEEIPHHLLDRLAVF